jgi:hypothetical protein
MTYLSNNRETHSTRQPAIGEKKGTVQHHTGQRSSTLVEFKGVILTRRDRSVALGSLMMGRVVKMVGVCCFARGLRKKTKQKQNWRSHSLKAELCASKKR